jgi:hypothetical protein
MRSLYLSFILFALPVLGSAQSGAAVSGPVSGYVFDQKAQALRPVVGVPGAAYLGGVALEGVEAAAVSPDGSAALVVKGGKLLLVRGLKSEPAAAEIEGAIEGAARIAWAANGAAAAVYAPAERRAQMLRKLDGAAEADAAMDLSALAGTVTALACGADGIAVGTADETAGGVYFLQAGAEPKLLAGAARPSGIALSGTDLYFADQERGQVWQVAGFAGDAAAMLFAEGLDAPVGVQAAGKRLFIATAGDRSLQVFDIEARAPAGRLELDVAPAQLEAFGGRALWLLNASGAEGEPLYVLDGGDNPAVYFVPAGRAE